ncbi:piggyBac transposable element-derived protein 4 [Trichonephila clavipes]|uniref:PiggyBac transposable element-derived protein 4 n=1 Tax=Trichonephila clavipes TaxID=2585209 RepID=A0A8X6SZA4_TRICX|nr:piggyBac transposable element-derived protein 4 [Trichonephila clavipes]
MEATNRSAYALSYQKLFSEEVAHQQLGKKEWSTTLDELDAFISIVYARAIRQKKLHDLNAFRQINSVLLLKFGKIYRKFDNFCYKLRPYITIDEQLFASKARCCFMQYMPSKPDKFDIKFWLAIDDNSKYELTAYSYLGKDEECPEDLSLSL